jgi:DNA replication protein DnaC
VEDWALVRRLVADGVPRRQVARDLGIGRSTVARALACDRPPRYERAAAPTAFTPFEPLVRQLLTATPDMPATVLAERVGWTGSITWFRDNVRLLRAQYRPVDPCDRLTWLPGDAAQCDLWFPPRRIPLEDGTTALLPVFDWDAQSAARQQVAALASGAFLTEARNVVLLGPPGTGKTHLATGLGIAAAHHGHRVLFATATEWVTRLTEAHRSGRLPQELTRLRRYRLIIVDEVGYLPFEQDAANLFFQLVSSRYEHASLILTSNLPFSGWGGVFGDQAVAAAMIDRVVHHADVLTLKGASYRLRNRGIDTLPSIRTQETAH